MDKINPLTGLYYNHGFYEEADKYLKTIQPDGYCMMAIDIEHFCIYNHIHGREEGDRLLAVVGSILKDYQSKHGGVIGYLGGDNFAILTVYDKVALEELRQSIRNEIRDRNNTAGYPPAYGIYPISDTSISAEDMYEMATLALSYVIGNYTDRCREYYPDMGGKIEEEIRLLKEIQDGMKKDEFTFFIQPQFDINKSKIVGGESLVRWIHGEKGMVSPGVFIPVLEKNGFIADLDLVVWEKVCKWFRSCLDRGFRPVPLSINVSRMDIFSVDVPMVLEGLVKKYDISPELLKVEITESAYAENSEKIIDTVNRLRSKGFLVMMDDFGTGYSSLGMLKSMPVDVLKMDMQFLEINENEEEKGIGILESVINMARQMRIPIIVEGVETQMQEDLLKKMRCRFTQGFYYYRPMATEKFEEMLADDNNLSHEGLWYRQAEPTHVREFLDTNLFSDDVFNSILGPVAFYDVYEDKIDITRVNDEYFQLMGISIDEKQDYRKLFWNSVRDDDRALLCAILEQAYENPNDGATGCINYLRRDGRTLWVYIRAFFLREKDGHSLFYASLTDATASRIQEKEISSLKGEMEDLTDNQMKHMEKYYGNIPCAFAVGRIVLDEAGQPIDYEITYANKELSHMSGGNMGRLRYMIRRLFPDKQDEFLEAAYKSAYDGETINLHIYSSLSSRYLDISLYQYQYGYICCMLQDITHSYIYESISNTIMTSFREVYFLELQDNYCRMIYPDGDNLVERGNYEEMINRHFAVGIIRQEDARKAREFLSLENLRRVLMRQDSVSCKYRRKIADAESEWCQTTISVTERRNGQPKTATVTIQSIESLMREKENEKRQKMAQVLGNMSEGFFIYRNNEEEKILYANPTVLKMFGCTSMEEFEELTGGSFKGMVHPEDLSRVEWEIKEQIENSDRNMDYICYRVICADGQIRWVDDVGHLENTEEGDTPEIFYVFLSDITDTITEAQKIKLLNMSKRFTK